MNIFPLHGKDAYKIGHKFQYPEGTTLVYSNFTPRSYKWCPIPSSLFDGRITFFGLQFFIKDYLLNDWNGGFFFRPKRQTVAKYARRVRNMVGETPVDHIEALHELGYLPLCIKALPEGVSVKPKTPLLVVYNTHPDFYWLTNAIETAMSNTLWKPTTSATTARQYRILMERYARRTGTNPAFVDFQAHDFSCRGMSNGVDAALSGAAHLTAFKGTDTISAIDLVEDYYGGNSDKEVIGASVPASEHSVMCMGGFDGEIDTFRRLITGIYPTGIVSIVSDTWDFWRVVNEYAPALKTEIMAREGRVIWRPDSGDPELIICGDPESPEGTPEHKGAVQVLWDHFGGTVNAAGYKVLDPHVGLIYGDSITIDRANAILGGLERKGFASENVVLGIGSFTYQHVTRDTYGFAVKSTYGEVKRVGRDIFKNPKTDDGVKKSARGLLAVKLVDGEYVVEDQQSEIDVEGCQLRPVFMNGRIIFEENFSEIRRRVRESVEAAL